MGSSKHTPEQWTCCFINPLYITGKASELFTVAVDKCWGDPGHGDEGESDVKLHKFSVQSSFLFIIDEHQKQFYW